MQLPIFLIIFIAEFLTTPKHLLFYDQIEYLKIASTQGFWQSIPSGHFPVHPIFQAVFWITSHLIIPNYTAFIFGIASGVLIYKICKTIFKGKHFWLPAIVFLLFPGVWLVNTNLMVHSVLLTFYLASMYFFLTRKKYLFVISNILLVGVHVDGFYWIPTILLLPFIFKQEIKLTKRDIFDFGKLTIFSFILAGAMYAAIYLFVRRDFGGSMEQILAYSSFGLLRIIRNIWVCVANSFGSITPILLLILLTKNIKSKKGWIPWILFVFLVSIGGAYWEGDLMMRRIVFAGVIISLSLYKYLGNKIIYLILFLLLITGLNAALYYKGTTPVLTKMQQEIDSLPKEEVLISSHYYYPFIHYEGKILWFETGEVVGLDEILKSGRRVFMTQESITAPYLLVVGNNYHITSLNRAGNSEARSIFKKYKIEPMDNSFEIKLPEANQVSEDAGEPVVFYGNTFWQRLSRMRINYGDVGVWTWSLIVGHKDAVSWTYKDASGAWVSP